MMKRILLALAATLFAHSLMAEDSPASRKEAAQMYVEEVPVKVMLKDVTQKMSATMNAEQRDQFTKIMNEVNVEPIEEAMIDAMVSNFTVEEIEAMTEFYSTEVGRSILTKFGSYTAQVNPAIQQEIQRAAKAIKQQ